MEAEIQRLFAVKGKVAVVTGGGRGIGLMISEGLVKNGVRVYIISRDQKVVDQAAEKLNRIGSGSCVAIAADLSNEEGCAKAVEEFSKHERHLDILVNNSGNNWAAPYSEYPSAAWDRVLNLNVKGVFLLTRNFTPLLKKNATAEDPSRVINIGSVDGIRVPKHETFAYSASKAALHQLTRVLAVRLSSDNITVNAVAAGPFESKMMAETLKKFGNEIAAATPRGRIGKPEDIIGVCIYLASQAGSYITGAIIPVEGGALLKAAM